MSVTATVVYPGQAGSSPYSFRESDPLKSPTTPSTPPSSVIDERGSLSSGHLDLDSPSFRRRVIQSRAVQAKFLASPSSIRGSKALMSNKGGGFETRQSAKRNGDISEAESSPIFPQPRRDVLAEISMALPEMRSPSALTSGSFRREIKLHTRRRRHDGGQKLIEIKLEDIASGWAVNPKANAQCVRMPRKPLTPKYTGNPLVHNQRVPQTPEGLAIQGLTLPFDNLEVSGRFSSPEQIKSWPPDLNNNPLYCLQRSPKSDIMSVDLEGALEKSNSETLALVLAQTDREIIQGIANDFKRNVFLHLLQKCDVFCKLSLCAGAEEATDSLNSFTSSPQNSNISPAKHARSNMNNQHSNKRRVESENDEAGEDDDGRRNKKPKAANTGPKKTAERYKCPFYVRAPDQFSSGKQHNCSADFKDIPKLKEHIMDRRHYFSYQCQRCQRRFKDASDLDVHVHSYPCESRAREPSDGISLGVWWSLKMKKQKAEEKKWPDIFELLFPGMPIPNREEYMVSENASTGIETNSGKITWPASAQMSAPQYNQLVAEQFKRHPAIQDFAHTQASIARNNFEKFLESQGPGVLQQAHKYTEHFFQSQDPAVSSQLLIADNNAGCFDSNQFDVHDEVLLTGIGDMDFSGDYSLPAHLEMPSSVLNHSSSSIPSQHSFEHNNSAGVFGLQRLPQQDFSSSTNESNLSLQCPPTPFGMENPAPPTQMTVDRSGDFMNSLVAALKQPNIVDLIQQALRESNASK